MQTIGERVEQSRSAMPVTNVGGAGPRVAMATPTRPVARA
jgi:hypothetical protein